MIDTFTAQNVQAWMRRNRRQFEDAQTGEVNMTALAEAAADAFGKADQDGPLDDETHWIWDQAAKFG